MINRQTVFVLGAGCSMPYGFPSGAQLVDEIIQTALANPTPETFNYAGFKNGDVQQFGHDLSDSDAQSIDTFLAYRPEFLQIGKLAIAMRMCIRENDATLSRIYRTPGENHLWDQTWYHYLWNEMATQRGQFGENKIAFVTFNYDRSLERYFFLRLRALHGYGNEGEIFDELYGLKFVHIHGSLGDDRFRDYPYQNKVLSHDTLITIASRLRIIHESQDENPNYSTAIDILKAAQSICFLGYGFHELNNKGLKLKELASSERVKFWFATRCGLTITEFNRRASTFISPFSPRGKFDDRVGSDSDGALELLRKWPVID